MVTVEEYEEAKAAEKAANDVIRQYHQEKADTFRERLKSGEPFQQHELHYSMNSLCPCGYGLAYPVDAGGNHYWDCAGILMGVADESVEHTAQLPFSMYKVKGENDKHTTRGVYLPKEKVSEEPSNT